MVLKVGLAVPNEFSSHVLRLGWLWPDSHVLK